MLFSSSVGVRVRITFSVWLVSGYAHEFVLLSAAIVTLPICEGIIIKYIIYDILYFPLLFVYASDRQNAYCT